MDKGLVVHSSWLAQIRVLFVALRCFHQPQNDAGAVWEFSITQFVYHEHAYHSSRLHAIKGIFGMAIIGVMLFSPLRKLLRPMFRQPG